MLRVTSIPRSKKARNGCSERDFTNFFVKTLLVGATSNGICFSAQKSISFSSWIAEIPCPILCAWQILSASQIDCGPWSSPACATAWYPAASAFSKTGPKSLEGPFDSAPPSPIPIKPSNGFSLNILKLFSAFSSPKVRLTSPESQTVIPVSSLIFFMFLAKFFVISLYEKPFFIKAEGAKKASQWIIPFRKR